MRLSSYFVWLAFVPACVLSRVPVNADERAAAVIAMGRELFEREWKPGEAGTRGGDGLGPSFNDVSCVGCHHQGGVGGGGPVDKNVDLISMPQQPRSMTRTQAKRLFRIHPGFFDKNMQPQTTFVLHRFNLVPDYAARRESFVGERNHIDPHPIVRDQLERYLAARPVPPVSAEGLRFHKSQRNTPALFGLGLLDKIPDMFLQELARRQPQLHPEISGRVGPTDNGAGRFGWRAQTARLHTFVLEACGNELGLQVPGVDQALSPDDPAYKPAGLDMTPAQSAAMIAFVASLPRPKQVIPQDGALARVVSAGRNVFAQTGCGACHLENLGPVQGVYSDLLLHDMGPGLRDPARARPTIIVTREAGALSRAGQQDDGDQEEGGEEPVRVPARRPLPFRGSSGAYGGGGASLAGGSVASTAQAGDLIFKIRRTPVPTNLEQEWQTPALWGVADSAPYLHDGRAQTLVEAIAWHGGEAKPAAERFFTLSAENQLAVIEFLRTLRAPRDKPN